MNKLFAFLSLFLFCGFVCNVKADDYGRNAVWRSSETCSAETAVLVTTGIIRVLDIQTTSGSVTASTFRYFNSTSAAFDLVNSTSIIHDITSRLNPPLSLDEILDDGFLYTKTGTACIRIRWRWESHINKHQAGLGLK